MATVNYFLLGLLFWLYLAIFVYFDYFWAIFGNFDYFWATFGYFDYFWATFGYFDYFLGYIWLFWLYLGYIWLFFDICWSILIFEKSTSGHSLVQKISLNDKSGRNAENYSFHSSFLEVPLLARLRCECSFLAFFSILWRNAAVNMQAIAIYLWCYIATTMTVKYSQTSIFINLQNMYKMYVKPIEGGQWIVSSHLVDEMVQLTYQFL